MRFRTFLSWLLVFFSIPLALLAKCPIGTNGTLEIRAPAGNLFVDTSGTDSVDVELSDRQAMLQESCGQDTVSVTATVPTVIGIPDWKIRVPKGVLLDLSTQGGNIKVDDTDGRETRLRTSGGKVTTGNIKGNALIYATEVHAGNIGGNAELRGLGGRLQVGNVGGNVLFSTTGGDIATGVVKGDVRVETGSGSVLIRESIGDATVTTQEGDIVSDYIHGSFDGRTDSGNIRIENVGGWFQAVTNVGDIFFRLVPEKLTGDLHVNVEAALGNITMYIPEKMKAAIDAVVDKPAYNAKRIFSDFPLKAPVNAFRNIPGGPEKGGTVINGGGNTIRVHTSVGTISIFSIKD